MVDEAQDLSAAHWKILRAMVPSEEDSDLDSDSDTLAGYRSVLHGLAPSPRGARNGDEEIDLAVE
ncbi:hypothetical protein [Streptomyces albogriseolus]|uniref:hypothetical protein n=1 Tax=Streptomyces albogriseolus TaxID=1887 RepID=UPI003460F9DC